MLDAISPETFDEWEAFRRLEPDPLDRLREVLKLGFAAVVNAWGVKVEPIDLDPWHEDAEINVDQDQAVSLIGQAYGITRK